MKKYILLILFVTNSVQSQTTLISQTSGSRLDYFKSHSNELLDENGNKILYSTDPDTLILNGEQNSHFGFSVSTAGDVNGDGYSDVIVGSTNFGSDTGRAFIFFGGTNMDNVADLTFLGEYAENRFGYSVSTAGDVNRDGYSDVIVAAEGYNVNTGRAYIFYGGTNMNSVADVILTGESTENRFGSPVSKAGDVNRDGYSDVIVGAYLYGGNKGRVYIYYGGIGMDNIADVIMTGEAVNNYFSKCSTAGDVNGDGYSDVIIGADGYNGNTGKAYIFFGGSNMNNLPDLSMIGESLNDHFGVCVTEAGDANGDGFSDVIVGAYGNNSRTGNAYIFNGGSSMNNLADDTISGEDEENYFGYSISTAGDINADGYSDLIIGAFGNNNFNGRAYLYFNIVPKPELLIPVNNSNNNPLTLNFKWKKYNASLFYTLNVSADSTFNNSLVSDTIYIDTSISVSGFQKGMKYFWKVKAMDTSGIAYTSSVWIFKTIPPIYLNLKILIEGMYFPIFNQMTRKDTVKVYLCNSLSPYNKLDSATTPIDSLSFTGFLKFYNAPSGTYYITAKHFNSIETWSKPGGETLIDDESIYNYDFTTSASQAYGNNLKRKGTKYCMFSGDINFDGVIDGSDAIRVHSDSYIFLTGNYLPTDLNGDNFVDGADYSIVDNNAYNFVVTIRP